MTTLKVCTWNVGDHGGKADLHKLMDRYAVIGLQEMGDRDGLYDAVKAYGWKALDGDGQNGKHSTPTIYNPAAGLELRDELVHKLSDQQEVNPGTGPETIKAKWAIGGQWHVDGYGDAFRFWTCHLVADSSSGERHELAHDQIVKLSKLFPEAEGACIIGGDLNTSWNNELVKPLKNKGWKSNHAADGGPCDTHGGWTPDHLWSRNASLTDQGTINTGSDHHALWAAYDLK